MLPSRLSNLPTNLSFNRTRIKKKNGQFQNYFLVKNWFPHMQNVHLKKIDMKTILKPCLLHFPPSVVKAEQHIF